jgi:glycosyltransferase involved in cell wall biosynthesis
MLDRTYAIITPTKNEEKYIEMTIKSVISQTILPIKWIIVNDGSKDKTEEIIRKYLKDNEFIQLFNLTQREKRDFSSQVYATNAGYKLIRKLDFKFLGILDADISFGPKYYEIMMSKMQKNSELGIVGGAILHKTSSGYKKDIRKSTHVGGGIQLFRRKCYDDIGGYIPMKDGGQDVVIEVMARMNGWEVKSFHEIEVLHHKPMGTGRSGIYRALYRQGRMEYFIGSHPIFLIAKCLRRLKEKPYVIGSILRMLGFSICYILRRKRQVSREYILFIRKEQINRLKLKFPHKINLGVDLL